MPDAQDPHMLLVFPDMEDDAVHAPALAVQQVRARKPSSFASSITGQRVGIGSRVRIALNKPVATFQHASGSLRGFVQKPHKHRLLREW